MPDPESDSVRPTLTNVIIIMKISVFVLIVIAMMIKAFNYLTEWPKFEKSVHRSDSQYIKNSLFEKTILSTVQRSIRRMSNVTLMRPNNGVHRVRVQIGYMNVGDGCWRRNMLVTSLRCATDLATGILWVTLVSGTNIFVTKFLVLSPTLGLQHHCSGSNISAYLKEN